MKIAKYFLLALIVACGPKQEKVDQLKVDPELLKMTIPDTVKLVSALTMYPKLLDSANNFQRGQPMPGFLFNYLLDYQYPFWTSHQSLSLRKEIFNGIKNKDLLHEILKSNDPRLKMTARPSEVPDTALLLQLPYRTTSNYQFASNRLKELK